MTTITQNTGFRHKKEKSQVLDSTTILKRCQIYSCSICHIVEWSLRDDGAGFLVPIVRIKILSSELYHIYIGQNTIMRVKTITII
jgi:hypothetical protein